jgi:hypothetical protein
VRAALLVLAAAAAGAALVGGYAALGGGDFEPPETGDPCERRDFGQPEGTDELIERIVLTAIDRAACDLNATRERVVLALATESQRATLARRLGVREQRVEEALRDGFVAAVDEAERVDALGGTTAALLRVAARSLPLDLVLAALEQFAD